MTKKYYYETTYEVEGYLEAVIGSAEVRFTYTVVWGCPARIRYDEHDHPGDSSEVEISGVEQEDWRMVDIGSGTPALKSYWRPVEDVGFADTLINWAQMDLLEKMLEEAQETDDDEKSEAMERRDEDRQETERQYIYSDEEKEFG